MKYLPSIAFYIDLSYGSFAQNDKYDKALADSLKADEYGMGMYQFVILKTGPEQLSDKKRVEELFKGHMANINKLADEGKLIVAGPFEKNDKSYRGLFILKARDKEEARQLLQTDPAIKAGLLASEIYGWYGSAALPMYIPFSKKVAKISF